jgi:hypothetical protein
MKERARMGAQYGADPCDRQGEQRQANRDNKDDVTRTCVGAIKERGYRPVCDPDPARLNSSDDR